MVKEDIKIVNSGLTKCKTVYVQQKEIKKIMGILEGKEDKVGRPRPKTYCEPQHKKAVLNQSVSNSTLLWENNRQGEGCLKDMVSSRISYNFELKVEFSDIDEIREFEVLETDSIILLMYEIISAMVYPYDDIQVYQLELSLDGKKLPISDWNKNISLMKSPAKVKVCYRRAAQPLFETNNLDKLALWNLFNTIAKSYQLRLWREKKLSMQSENLAHLLRYVPENFRNLLIEALNMTQYEVKDGTNVKSYTLDEMHMIVIYCFQDFFDRTRKPREEFMNALKLIILKAKRPNLKLNALKILAKWISNFSRRDFNPAKISSALKQHYNQIMNKIDEDIKALHDFQRLKQDLRLFHGSAPTSLHPKGKGTPTRVKADFIYFNCLKKFEKLCAGDFANCGHGKRKKNDAIKAMTDFFNTICNAVILDILSQKNKTTKQRADRIDEWIQVAYWLYSHSKDFHSAKAIVASLNSYYIFRLKNSWKFVKYGPFLQEVNDKLTNNNYAYQRSLLKSSLPKDEEAHGDMVIPFLCIILKDLEKLDNLHNKSNNNSVNKWKYHLVSECVSSLISQIKKNPSTVRECPHTWKLMEELFEQAKEFDKNKMEKIADTYFREEKEEVLCYLGTKSWLFTLTLMNVSTLGSLFYILYSHFENGNFQFYILFLFVFGLANVISCWVTHSTEFNELDEYVLFSDEIKERKECCTCSRITSYLFDLTGLGILPAFWRALSMKRIHENIYGERGSLKKEFMRQNGVSALGLHLPLVVLWLYCNFQNEGMTRFEKRWFLIIPFVSISYSSFLIYRGAYESVFLVGRARIIVFGFLTLATDFFIRTFSWVGLLSYLLRAAECDGNTNLCRSLMFEHGEDFCFSEIIATFPNGGTVSTECCQCGGGQIPTYNESLTLKLYAVLLVAGVFLYEIIWVIIFHRQMEMERCPGKLSKRVNCKNFLIKIMKAIMLSVTFLTVSIPVLGMRRPKYRDIEHYIRILMSIVFGLLFYILDTLIDDTSLLIAMCSVFPIHLISYILFENHVNKGFTVMREENHQDTKRDHFQLSDSLLVKDISGSSRSKYAYSL